MVTLGAAEDPDGDSARVQAHAGLERNGQIDIAIAQSDVRLAEDLIEAWLRLDLPRLTAVLQKNRRTETGENWIANRRMNVAQVALGLKRHGCSETQLRRIFAAAGCLETPGAMINRLKMTISAELLRSNKLTISAIAEQMHISDVRNFSRRFKSFHGLRPRDFRHLNGTRAPERATDRTLTQDLDVLNAGNCSALNQVDGDKQ